MQRRSFLLATGATVAAPLLPTASLRPALANAIANGRFEAADAVLHKAVETQQVSAAAMLLRRGTDELRSSYGAAKDVDAMFLLASITKPICVTAMMTLFDQGKFKLDDRVSRFIPEFQGAGRNKVLIRHLLTHVCGLPDQLPENQRLRKEHAPLSTFVSHAIKTPMLFPAGSKYSYSSMGILLAAEIVQRITSARIHEFMDDTLFKPLQMRHSALGLGRFPLAQMMKCQTQQAAPESGAGAASATDWDWNSAYWRAFGAPWGGAHGSVIDVAKFFDELLRPQAVLKPATAALITRNHNASGQRARGLGFGVGVKAGSPGCSKQTFGHTGSTGTLAWADPTRNTLCIVLTTLPGTAAQPHPRTVVSDLMAK